MKPILKPLIVLLGLVSLSACNGGCHGLGKKGNGHITTQTREVSTFNKLSLKGIFPVEISQTGGAEWVKVEADENLQKDIMVRNEGDELVIESPDSTTLGRPTKMKVYVNVKNLDALNFKSIGSFNTANTLKLDSLNLTSESVGKLDLDIEANYLHADLESVGNTTFSGMVSEVRINNKGIGALHAFDLKAHTLMIHNTGIGVVGVYADSAFYIRSSSIGLLKYKGPGEVKELKVEGIGKVEKGE